MLDLGMHIVHVNFQPPKIGKVNVLYLGLHNVQVIFHPPRTPEVNELDPGLLWTCAHSKEGIQHLKRIEDNNAPEKINVASIGKT
jgi:hypothetical protein